MNSLVTTALSLVMAMGIGANPVTPASNENPTQDILQAVTIPATLAVDTNDPKISQALTSARSYVDLSTKAWDAQSLESYWDQKSVETTQEVERTKKKAQEADAAATVAAEKAEESRLEAAKWYRTVQQNGGVENIDPAMTALLMGPDDSQAAMNAYNQIEKIAERREADLERSMEDKEAADKAKELADAENAKAEELAAQAQTYLETARTSSEQADQLADEAQTEWTNVWRSLGNSEGAGVPTGNKVFNVALIEAWNARLEQIRNSGVTVPTAAELTNTTLYPEGIEQVDAVVAQDITGVGRVGEITIPSQEAIARTSKALSSLGQTYVTDGDGTQGWGCEAFVSNAVGANGASLSDIYTNSGRQNVSLSDTTSGDIVFFSDPQAGIHQGGVFVLGGFVVNSSAAAGFVSADSVGVDALGSVRPGTQAVNNAVAPVKVPGSADWKCGGIVGAVDASQNGWTLPIPKDLYTLGAKFNAAEARFGDKNPGLEFLAEGNQSVFADFDGTVTDVGNDPTWGQYVVITHADGLTTRYSSLSAVSVALGASVTGGAVVGVVGNTGTATNTTKPGVLVVITANGENIDPESVFFPAAQGQYPNGQIPASALCPVFNGTGLLRCDAARALSIMAAAYERDLGKPLVATDTYRSFEGQVQCRANKGDMCAVPGTSNHGWGLAVDFSGGIETFGTAEHEWMQANATKYGWYHPDWAEPSGSKPEAWHWEYIAAK